MAAASAVYCPAFLPTQVLYPPVTELHHWTNPE